MTLLSIFRIKGKEPACVNRRKMTSLSFIYDVGNYKEGLPMIVYEFMILYY